MRVPGDARLWWSGTRWQSWHPDHLEQRQGDPQTKTKQANTKILKSFFPKKQHFKPRGNRSPPDQSKNEIYWVCKKIIIIIGKQGTSIISARRSGANSCTVSFERWSAGARSCIWLRGNGVTKCRSTGFSVSYRVDNPMLAGFKNIGS